MKRRTKLENNEQISRAFGQILKSERLARRMSQEKLAESGLTPNYISELERGIKSPTVNSVFKICHVFSMKPSELFKKIEEHIEEGNQ